MKIKPILLSLFVATCTTVNSYAVTEEENRGSGGAGNGDIQISRLSESQMVTNIDDFEIETEFLNTVGTITIEVTDENDFKLYSRSIHTSKKLKVTIDRFNLNSTPKKIIYKNDQGEVVKSIIL